jgi:hypothetical protein
MDVVEHLAKLELEVADLKFSILFSDHGSSTYNCKKSARKLMHALEMVEHCLSEARREAKEKEERTVRVVK